MESSTTAERMSELCKKARNRLGLSQRKFAEYLTQHGAPISATGIQDIENARVSKPNPELWLQISPLAGYQFEEAMKYLVVGDQPTDMESQIVEAIDYMSYNSLTKLLILIGKKLQDKGSDYKSISAA